MNSQDRFSCAEQCAEEMKHASKGEPLKFAQKSAAALIQDRLRETGFFRAILPFQTPQGPERGQGGDWSVRTDVRERFILGEMVNMTPEPVPVNFEGAAPQAAVDGIMFEVFLFDITSPQLYAHIRKIERFSHDPLEYYTANIVKDFGTLEDKIAILTVENIVGNAPNTPSPITGELQNIILNTDTTNAAGIYTHAFNKKVIEEASTLMLQWRVPSGTVLVNQTTFSKFAGNVQARVEGDALANDLTRKGIGGLEKAELLGKRFLGTIKNDIVADNTAYIFSEPDFIGLAFERQAPTMYIQKYIKTLKLEIREEIGATFANRRGFAKVTFLLNGQPEVFYPDRSSSSS